ncbi:MAG: 16S rRNA (uracil(1498)-N(3))-methyltransferase [Planctomycetes bacterium]|nr:16S rRNA (uracil(1498)-N(3))-methyltransferase [Planctomycetota bacterium]
MSGLRRFFCSQQPLDNRLTLGKPESHHLINVLRLKPGSQIEVFNGSGNSFLSEVITLDKDRAELMIVRPNMPDKSQLEITLATAIPKGSRMDWLVEKAAELGLKRLIPLITKRSVVVIDNSSPKLSRWSKLAVAAAKQTGQSEVLRIMPPQTLDQLARTIKDYDLSLIAVPTAKQELNDAIEKAKTANRILYLIGPEGDFTADEIKQAAQAGLKPVRLPVKAILRVETAALAMLAMLWYHYGNTDEHR